MSRTARSFASVAALALAPLIGCSSPEPLGNSSDFVSDSVRGDTRPPATAVPPGQTAPGATPPLSPRVVGDLDYEHPNIRAITAPENIVDLAWGSDPHGRIRTDFAPNSTAPIQDAMSLSVRHMGGHCNPGDSVPSPACQQLLTSTATSITWDVGHYTGFRPTSPVGQWQFGQFDSTLEVGPNAYQLQGTTAGVMINTWSFDHTTPVVGGGPNVVFAINYSQLATPFVHPSSELTLQAQIKLPWAASWKGGIGQLSLFFYLRDKTTGQSIAYVAGIWDSRAFGDGNGTEFIGHDTQVSFVSSPLLPGMRYSTLSPYSQAMRNTTTWETADFFRVHVSGKKLVDAVNAIEAAHHVTLSKTPSDYELTTAGILQEVFAGTDPQENMSMGASFTDFSVYEFY